MRQLLSVFGQVDLHVASSVADPLNADPDPAIFVSDLQTSTKNYFFPLLKVHIHHFSEIKSAKEVTKQEESVFLLLFLLKGTQA